MVEASDYSDNGGDAFFNAARADDKLTASVSYQQVTGAPGSSVEGAAGPASPRRHLACEVYEAPGGPDGGGSEHDTLSPFSGTYVDQEWYYQTCRDTGTGELVRSSYWRYASADPVNPGPDLAAMARQAYDEVPFPHPVPRTSPGIDVEQVTGLPTWLWLEPGSFTELSARAEIPGFWVEASAHPEAVAWDMGDGDSITCDGPGTPYDPARDDDAQRTDCSHVYLQTSDGQPGGQFQASVTVRWSVRWQASTGAAGILADATRTTTFGLTVTERQAVVAYRP